MSFESDSYFDFSNLEIENIDNNFKNICSTGDEQQFKFPISTHSNLVQQLVYDDQIVHESIPEQPQDLQDLVHVVDTIIRPKNEEGIQQVSTRFKKGNKKNSNTIKKIGRIIISNIDMFGQDNEGVKKMKKKLHEKKENSNIKNMIDGFNTSHLQALFNVEDEKLTKFNLRTSKTIFKQVLRQEVFKSYQIKGEDQKKLYLNSLKVSALRFMNKTLATRLQTSENQK